MASGLFAGASSQSAWARSSEVPVTADSPLASLPREARATYQAVLSGGPFRYHQDGVVFGNRERLLPRNARGYYHEYTVKTPGASNRGARRIICGGLRPTQPDACYYTADHYNSFSRITP